MVRDIMNTIRLLFSFVILAACATIAQAELPVIQTIQAQKMLADVIPPAKGYMVLPFEDLGPFEELPDYVYSFSYDVYIRWAKAQNEKAVIKAAEISDEFVSRNPLTATYLQTNSYDSHVNQTQSESVSPTTANFSGQQNIDYNGSTLYTTYFSDKWGGGPVNIINPFCKRPPKVIGGKLNNPDNK